MKVIVRRGPTGLNRYSVRTKWTGKFLRKDWEQRIIQGTDPDLIIEAEKNWPYFTAHFDTRREAEEAMETYETYCVFFKERDADDAAKDLQTISEPDGSGTHVNSSTATPVEVVKKAGRSGWRLLRRSQTSADVEPDADGTPRVPESVRAE